MNEGFQSSDSIRAARPLAVAQTFDLPEPFAVHRGGTLPQVRTVYETYGELNARRDNAVLICHALSGDSHVARHWPQDDPGWWDLMVGPGKPIDTERYFVICNNILGGCRGTTGPNSINPQTGKPYGASFPVITVDDMVEVQARLMTHLGIEKLHAVVGGSLGGHLALAWAQRFPQRVASVVAIATSARLTSQALAFDIVGRNAILHDPAYRGGQFYDDGQPPAVGLAIARMLGHITYLSREAMTQKFDADRLSARDNHTDFETRFSVGSYLAYQGDKFVDRFDANSYVVLTTAMDLFDLGGTPAQIAANLRLTPCRWLLISISSDWLFPPFQSRQIVDALLAQAARVSYCEVNSECGHDAFLLPNDLALYGEMTRAFLQGADAAQPDPGDDSLDQPTSIFHGHRLDYDRILDLIPLDASVLDLGCGAGGLLSRLRQRGHRRLLGIEFDQRQVLETLRRGHDVVRADINQGLSAFADGQFDVVVLSQTLQAITEVELVLGEVLRVGRLGIVSFPNLAYRPLRQRLAEEGRSPRGTALQGMAWYNTPNLRFLTISDFTDFCQERSIQVYRMVALDTQRGTEVTDDPNLNADAAVFVIQR